MRFLELNFLAYGCFTNHRLDLSKHGQALHVIYGPNEAGKSTALRGLTDFLYGIPSRSTDNFLHKNPALRVAARLLDEDDREHEFVRRKGTRDTLSDTKGKVVSDANLGRLLRGLPRDLFETLFRIDHDSLVEGGHALLDGKGELATTLFQAGAGILGVRQVMADLDTEADRIFKSRASNPPLNKALQQFQDKKKTIRDASLNVAEWKKLAAELEENKQRKKELDAQYGDRSAELERLKRIRQAQLQATRRAELHLSLIELGNVPHIPETDIATREAATRRLAADRERCELAHKQIADWENQVAGLTAPLEVLNHATEIQELVQGVDSFRKAMIDLPKREKERIQLEAEARAKLSDVRPDLSLDQARSLRLTAPERTKIQRLVGEFAKLETKLSGVHSRNSKRN
ncbi:MAG: AAA family ATPase [Planctomycetota bacterium]|nr:AAA family ATPase [Planctomycetota bacterium]